MRFGVWPLRRVLHNNVTTVAGTVWIMATQTVPLQLCSPLLSYRKNFTQPHPVKTLKPLLSRERRIEDVTFDVDYFLRRVPVRRNFVYLISAATSGNGGPASELDGNVKKLLQASLWIAEFVYVVWLFLLPYAPGDPIWAISQETIKSLIGLSLNFFFILPLSNSVGIHLMEAPVHHPVSEGLFNFVIGWTLLFAPLLYSDKRRHRYKGSLDVLWGFQMFLTNTFLIPYMAIRLNDADEKYSTKRTSKLGSLMTNGASVVGLVGGFACILSIFWGVYGRRDGNYDDLADRIEFLQYYLGSERLAYAFIWDILLYTAFQPWLIGDNLDKIQKDKVGFMNVLRFFPVIGLVAYCLFLDTDREI